MPYYRPLKDWTDDNDKFKSKKAQKRVVEKLIALRQQLKLTVPPKTARESLLLATWNIREFGDNRLPETYFYLAEIIEFFDLVAVQEVSSDVKGLEKLIAHMGRNWHYIVTDATEGSAGGGERMAFLYDSRKVSFRNIAGEVVLPKEKLIDGLQFARSPFLCAFQAGWFKFNLCTVHIFYGEDSATSEGMKRRIAEIDALAKWFNKKAKNEDTNYFLLGDFNIVDKTHATMKALEDNGYFIPEQIKKTPTNLEANKHYDQIAFQVKEHQNMLIFDRVNGRAGTVRYYDTVFKDDEAAAYKDFFKPEILEGKTDKQIETYFKSKYRTFQMSDHLPLWVELRIDFSDEYLKEILVPEDKKRDLGDPPQIMMTRGLEAPVIVDAATAKKAK